MFSKLSEEKNKLLSSIQSEKKRIRQLNKEIKNSCWHSYNLDETSFSLLSLKEKFEILTNFHYFLSTNPWDNYTKEHKCPSTEFKHHLAEIKEALTLTEEKFSSFVKKHYQKLSYLLLNLPGSFHPAGNTERTDIDYMSVCKFIISNQSLEEVLASYKDFDKISNFLKIRQEHLNSLTAKDSEIRFPFTMKEKKVTLVLTTIEEDGTVLVSIKDSHKFKFSKKIRKFNIHAVDLKQQLQEICDNLKDKEVEIRDLAAEMMVLNETLANQRLQMDGIRARLQATEEWVNNARQQN